MKGKKDLKAYVSDAWGALNKLGATASVRKIVPGLALVGILANPTQGFAQEYLTALELIRRENGTAMSCRNKLGSRIFIESGTPLYNTLSFVYPSAPIGGKQQIILNNKNLECLVQVTRKDSGAQKSYQLGAVIPENLTKDATLYRVVLREKKRKVPITSANFVPVDGSTITIQAPPPLPINAKTSTAAIAQAPPPLPINAKTSTTTVQVEPPLSPPLPINAKTSTTTVQVEPPLPIDTETSPEPLDITAPITAGTATSTAPESIFKPLSVEGLIRGGPATSGAPGLELVGRTFVNGWNGAILGMYSLAREKGERFDVGVLGRYGRAALAPKEQPAAEGAITLRDIVGTAYAVGVRARLILEEEYGKELDIDAGIGYVGGRLSLTEEGTSPGKIEASVNGFQLDVSGEFHVTRKYIEDFLGIKNILVRPILGIAYQALDRGEGLEGKADVEVNGGVVFESVDPELRVAAQYALLRIGNPLPYGGEATIGHAVGGEVRWRVIEPVVIRADGEKGVGGFMRDNLALSVEYRLPLKPFGNELSVGVEGGYKRRVEDVDDGALPLKASSFHGGLLVRLGEDLGLSKKVKERF